MGDDGTIERHWKGDVVDWKRWRRRRRSWKRRTHILAKWILLSREKKRIEIFASDAIHNTIRNHTQRTHIGRRFGVRAQGKTRVTGIRHVKWSWEIFASGCCRRRHFFENISISIVCRVSVVCAYRMNTHAFFRNYWQRLFMWIWITMCFCEKAFSIGRRRINGKKHPVDVIENVLSSSSFFPSFAVCFRIVFSHNIETRCFVTHRKTRHIRRSTSPIRVRSVRKTH